MLDRFVAYNAHCAGEAIAFGNLSRQQSYAVLEGSVSRFARALEGLRKLAPRRVAVQCADTWRHWGLVLALGRLGLASASLPHGEVPEEELAVLQPDIIILDGAGLPAGEGRLILDEGWFERVLDGVEQDGPSQSYKAVSVAPTAPCRAALASGTNRDVHLLELSFAEVEVALHRLMYQDMTEFFARNEGRRGRSTEKPQLLCTVGPQSLSGYLMTGAALAAGTTVRSSDSQNIGVEVMRAPALMIAMTSAHLEHLLKALPPRMEPMEHVYLSVVGGQLSQDCLRRTRAQFTPHVQVVYGTDECGAVTAITAETRESEESVGPPLPWADVEIVAENGEILPRGEVGDVRIRGVNVVRGYLDDSEVTRQRFRDGWFYPGDRGFLSPKGELHLKGRVDDIVSIGGGKFDLGVVEEIVRSEPSIQDVGVFFMYNKEGRQQLYAAIVSHQSFDQEALSRRLRQRYATLPPIAMIWVPDIPRTTENHVDRGRLERSLGDYIRAGMGDAASKVTYLA